MSIVSRLGRAKDAVSLPAVERSAGESFRDVPDLAWVADHGATPLEECLELISEGTVWVAEDEAARIVGFVMAEEIDRELHIWELAVRRDHQRKGVGGRLMQTALIHAQTAGHAAVTLTTFRDIAWNEPFYAGLGFQTLRGTNIGKRLSENLAREIADGFPGDRRCAMRRTLAD